MKEKLPPIQFKNPNVQFVLLTNRKPTPFVNIYFGRCVTALCMAVRDTRLLLTVGNDSLLQMMGRVLYWTLRARNKTEYSLNLHQWLACLS